MKSYRNLIEDYYIKYKHRLGGMKLIAIHKMINEGSTDFNESVTNDALGMDAFDFVGKYDRPNFHYDEEPTKEEREYIVEFIANVKNMIEKYD